jgi:iron complex outermembrane receptor protein
MNKHVLLMSCALGALALSSGGAYAAAAAAATTDTGAASTVSEVIVTAEKREANIQTVPIAVTAFTSKERALEGINTIQDMTDFTPGFTYSSQLDRPVMRGLSRNNNFYTIDSAVAIYYDDFFAQTTFLVGRDDMLIDQVEILLGPQGTLYGRNAIGGLINTLSKRPTDTWQGEVREQAGNYGYNKVEGTISGPITDNLAFRASFYDLNQSRGYFTNLVPGMPSEGDVRHDPYVDLQFEYKTDKDDLWLDAYALTFNNDRGGPGGLLGVPYVGPLDTAISTPGFPLAFNPNFPCGGGAVPGSVVGEISCTNPASSNIRDFAHSIPTDINVRGAYAVVMHETHHMDGFDIKYVGGWDQYRYNLFTADPFTPDNSGITQYEIPLNPPGATGLCAAGLLGPCGPLTVNSDVQFQYETETNWFSHEITFSSTTNSPVQWIAGAYYYNETDNQIDTWSAPQQAQVATPLQVLPLLGAGKFVPAAPNKGNYLLVYDYQDSINSVATYGQVDWKITPTIKLTGGLRYTYDYKSVNEETRFVDENILSPANFGTSWLPVDITPLEVDTGPGKGITCATQFPTTGPYAGYATRCLGDHSAALTGTAGIEWTPDPETLAYLRYNRGYKAFALNPGQIAFAPEAKPENVDDVEAGVKKTFGHTLTIDADAFYYNYVNDQTPIGVPLTTAAGTVIQTQFINIPKAVSDGFELVATWTPVDRLNLTLTYGLDHTSILTTCTLVGTVPTGACYADAADPQALAAGARPVGTSGVQAVNGNELPNAPENKVAFNANYTIPFGDNALILSGSFVWKDKSYGDIFERWYYEAPGWDQVDLRATWSGNHDRYEVVLYVKNLFNTVGYDAGAAGYDVAAPFGGGAQTNATAYDLTPPRLYGVELHFKF